MRECLEECYRSDDWLLTLASYAERLRADGWSRAEVQEVEATARRILGAVLQGESLTLQLVRQALAAPNVPAQNSEVASAST